MTSLSSTLVRRIPWREEPGGLQSKWPQRVKHDWVTENTQHVLSIAQNVKVLKSIAELRNQQNKMNEGFFF